jgi:branched-chain amino acid transport system substrate-binding protein
MPSKLHKVVATLQAAVARHRCALRVVVVSAVALAMASVFLGTNALANDPPKPPPSMKVGFSVPLTGDEARKGEQILLALQLWRDDVNAKGGLLHRPVELVYHDDQSNPGKVPAIYRKLISEEKVDLILGPSTTVLSAASMRVISEFGRVEISILGIGANRMFAYPRFFAMPPFGTAGAKTVSQAFFDLAAKQQPKLETVALLTEESELPKAIANGARDNAAAPGMKVIYDKSYSTGASDIAAAIDELKAANADLVLILSGARDLPAVVQKATEQGIAPKIFGVVNADSLNGGSSNAQSEPAFNGTVSAESFALAPSLNFPGQADLLKRYRAEAGQKSLDPSGVPVVPFAYAAGQILAQAVTETGTDDPDKLAEYIHNHTFNTVVGPIEYDPYGEWKQPRVLLTQSRQHAADGGKPGEDNAGQSIVWPPQYKTDDLIYPYPKAKK